jgi:hypothetical protein
MVLGGEEGGWWPVAALVGFYGTDEGRRTTCGVELTEEGRRRCSGVIPVRAAVLRRSRLMHGLCGEGRKGRRRASVPSTATEQ